MFEETNLNEEGQARRRRRSEMHPEAAESFTEERAAQHSGDQVLQPSAEQDVRFPEEPVSQTADSRVPPEARRMAASPYGESNAPAAKRPGTRPPTAARRPAQEPRRIAPGSGMLSGITSEESAPGNAETDSTRTFDASRISVGYAPGRMKLDRTAQESAQELRKVRKYDREGRDGSGRQMYGRESRDRNGRESYGRDIYSREAHERDPRDPRNLRMMQEGRYGIRMPGEREPERSKSHPVMWTITALLLIVGLAAVILLSLPEGNSLRMKATDAVGAVTGPVEDLLERTNRGPARIESFTVTGQEKTTAPADVVVSVMTDTSVSKVRLVDEDGREVAAELTSVENTDNNYWTLTMRVKDGYEGQIRLQTRRERQVWMDTDYSVDLHIAPLTGSEASSPEGIRNTGTETSNPEKTGLQEETGADGKAAAGFSDEDGAGEKTATGFSDDGKAGEETAAGAQNEDGTDEESAAGSQDETGAGNDTELQDNAGEDGTSADGIQNGAENDGETAEDREDYGDALWGVPWGGTEAPDLNATSEETPAPTDTPEPTPEPTPTPPLTAAADPDADPSLITTTVVYDGSKKVKEYMRAAKALIHMPDGEDYTMKKIGVLTFRGNAFRQNAAVGTVETAAGLTEIWQTEAGSSRGASQTFYGYEWTGQPAIVKWSTQVRAASNIDEDKKTKNALREVIIAGVDGVIRFIDLEDGSLTRGAINLGYPMKGTPSLHPAGYPYMSVGQYTRKMKVKTGKIGLRQYNLYNQKELTLIDGLDGKMHRGINKYGSFETSALIDRTSDTMITLGTNGLLYLTSLNTEFDYQAGTLKTTPGSIVMASRAKGEKKDELVAVEACHAMYDRYVFYADMGGILRCVDTNYLKPVWAVNTGDAVMASVALDLNGSSGLDLYTANMLTNRKKGPAQIRRYDALSGKEIWTTEIGVAKNTKTKEDVGVKASPVIGQNGLSELVYFTVTGLDEEGRAALGVGEETKAAIVALEKENGQIRWARGLSDRSESSPVAVYDRDGNGWIVQCAEDGTILLLEGLTGTQTAELQLDAKIKASPAVYNDIMVIGTTGKGTEAVYGIRIR